jgi:hypothetical protein
MSAEDLQVAAPLSDTAQFVKDSEGNPTVLALSKTRVGVGTVTPISVLTVKGGGSAPLVVQGDTNNYAMLGLVGDTAPQAWQIQATNGAETFFNIAYPQAAPKLTIRQNGFVGIGTITPGATLDVTGSIKGQTLALSGTLTVSGAVTISGPLAINATQTTISNIVDVRLAPTTAVLQTLLVDKGTGKLYAA